ncbi:hypothetical protein FHT80_002645 [Rhizobium sp. BK226]|nr:hypothetical protein [Rhizobium sp. BK226]MBB4182418.1 hypothetical protein [Rhizobium sp. BK109]
MEAVDETRQFEIVDRRAGAADQIQTGGRSGTQGNTSFSLAGGSGIDTAAEIRKIVALLANDLYGMLDRGIGKTGRFPGVVGRLNFRKSSIRCGPARLTVVSRRKRFCRDDLCQNAASPSKALRDVRLLERRIPMVVFQCGRRTHKREGQQWKYSQ